MFAETLPILNIPTCRRDLSRRQLVPKLKCAKISREAKSFLAFLLRPSWKRIFHRLRHAGSTTTTTETLVSSCSCDTETLVDDSTETSSDLSQRKASRPYDSNTGVIFDTVSRQFASTMSQPSSSEVRISEHRSDHHLSFQSDHVLCAYVLPSFSEPLTDISRTEIQQTFYAEVRRYSQQRFVIHL